MRVYEEGIITFVMKKPKMDKSLSELLIPCHRDLI